MENFGDVIIVWILWCWNCFIIIIIIVVIITSKFVSVSNITEKTGEWNVILIIDRPWQNEQSGRFGSYFIWLLGYIIFFLFFRSVNSCLLPSFLGKCLNECLDNYQAMSDTAHRIPDDVRGYTLSCLCSLYYTPKPRHCKGLNVRLAT